MPPLQKLVIEYVDIDSVTPNNYNPNRQADKEFELLCRSIEEDGFTQPIIVHKETNQIVDGEHRWRALKVLSAKNPKFLKIPVVMVDMDMAQRMIATLRHNRARGSENINKAADVIRELQSLGALDHASDSLIMDDVELNIFLEEIPSNELTLRNPGDKLTAQAVEDIIQQEREFSAQKNLEEEAMWQQDDSTYFLQMTYTAHEAGIVSRVLGKDKTAKVLELCHLAKEHKI